MAYNPMAFVHNVPASVAKRIAATRPVRPTSVRPAPVRPAPRRVSQTIDQAAAAQVNQLLAPQLAGQAAYGRQQNAAIQGFAQALMGKLQPLAGQVGADWNQAIGQTGELANRAATFLQQANPNASLQALIPGAPPEQQQQLADQMGQTFGGGAAVLNFLGGAVPGTQMATEKAAAQTQAAQYPALAALRGQQDLASALWKQSTDRQTIEAQRPQLFQTARQNITQNVQARQRAAQARINEIDKVTQQRITAEIAMGFNPATGELTPVAQAKIDKISNDAAIAKARIGIAATNAATGQTRAATGQTNAATGQQRAQVAWYNAQTARWKATHPKASAVRAAPQLTALQIQKYRGDAAGIANNGKAGQIWDKKQGKYVSAPVLSPYQTWQEMRQHGVPDVIAIDAINRAYGTNFNPKGKLP